MLLVILCSLLVAFALILLSAEKLLIYPFFNDLVLCRNMYCFSHQSGKLEHLMKVSVLGLCCLVCFHSFSHNVLVVIGIIN